MTPLSKFLTFLCVMSVIFSGVGSWVYVKWTITEWQDLTKQDKRAYIIASCVFLVIFAASLCFLSGAKC